MANPRPNFFEHLHPPTIPARSASFFYTFGLGGISLLLVIAVTGMLEIFVYQPSQEGAYSSVSEIAFEAPYGWFVRNLHYWAGQWLVVTATLHMARVVLTGGYKRRRGNWLIGVSLLILVLPGARLHRAGAALGRRRKLGAAGGHEPAQRHPVHRGAVYYLAVGGSECHSGTPEKQLDHIPRVERSIQATYAGAIALIQRIFGLQPDGIARMGISAAQSYPGAPDNGGRPYVQAIEAFQVGPDAPPLVDQFADRCLTCHLRSQPIQEPYSYRATACKVAATFIDVETGEAVRVLPHPQSRLRALDYAPSARTRWQAQLDAYQIMPDEELLAVQPVRLRFPLEQLLSKPGRRVTCETCGEEINNEREVVHEGKFLCRACAGYSYYRLRGGSQS